MIVNILLFPEFETLDAFGPVEVLGHFPGCQLRYVSMQGGPVKSRQGFEVLTESVKEADLTGILLVPGGQGTRTMTDDPEFIESLKKLAEQSEYCLTVCTGSELLAKTGLLNGRKATSNKIAFKWVRLGNEEVHWVSRARWVSDGKYYTSSGVSAGIDMTLGFLADRYGADAARKIADSIEYIWNSDPEEDRFAK